VAQVVEDLPSKPKTLSSISDTKKKKKSIDITEKLPKIHLCGEAIMTRSKHNVKKRNKENKKKNLVL
jgi:hypothetical protein